jgi:hypothetical protein
MNRNNKRLLNCTAASVSAHVTRADKFFSGNTSNSLKNETVKAFLHIAQLIIISFRL